MTMSSYTEGYWEIYMRLVLSTDAVEYTDCTSAER